MKKIIYIIFVLVVVMCSICACNTNEENNNVEINNSEITNQIGNTNNTNQTEGNPQIEAATQDDVLNEAQKEDENQNTEIIIESTETIKQNEIDLSESINTNLENSSSSISVSATALSNKKCAWGFVRQKNEVRPQFSAGYIKPLDDYEGIYAGNSEQKIIYLTFDEGYENGYTGAILDTLKEKNCPATFFVTKSYVKQNQDLVKRMIDEGHIVGNHIPVTSMYHIKIS